jgi:hypothetical protein
MNNFAVGDKVVFNTPTYKGTGFVVNIYPIFPTYNIQVQFDTPWGEDRLCFNESELEHLKDDIKLEDFL